MSSKIITMRHAVHCASILSYPCMMITPDTTHIILPIDRRDFERCCPEWAASSKTGFGPTNVQTYWISVGAVNAIGITDVRHILECHDNQVATLTAFPTIDDFTNAIRTTPSTVEQASPAAVYLPTWQMASVVKANIRALLLAVEPKGLDL